MYKFLTSNLFSTSVVNNVEGDAFGMRSRQVLVRDDVSFAPGVDPHQGLLLMIERLNSARPVHDIAEKKDAVDHGMLSAG